MTTWADFRVTLRQSMLADIDEVNFEDAQLLDCYKFALDALCAHTAVPMSIEFTSSTVKTDTPTTTYYDMAVDTVFTLPDDVYEPIDVSGRIRLVDGEARITYPDPVLRTPGMSPYRSLNAIGYWLWPEYILNLTKAAGANSILSIEYFAYYPYPADDTDELSHPRWAGAALQYLTAAHALSSYSVQSASIDRFKDKYDSGNPEQNSLRVQQVHFLNLYERELARRPSQDRSNFFRSDGMTDATR